MVGEETGGDARDGEEIEIEIEEVLRYCRHF